MSELKADGVKAVALLRLFHGDGSLDLTAIDPDRIKPLRGKTFGNGDDKAAAKWIADRNSAVATETFGVYHHVNPLLGPVAESGEGAKAKKTDVKSVAWLHTDIDPDPQNTEDKTDTPEEHREKERAKIRARIESYPIPPTLVIDSGNGYQVFWKLTEEQPVNGNEAKAEELERYNRQLTIALGGDKNCHDVCRVMRAPYSLNFPNEKKRGKGWGPSMACEIEFHPERVYPITRFKQAPPLAAKAQGGGMGAVINLSSNRPRYNSVDDFPPKVALRTKMVIVQGLDPDEPNKHPSRSEWSWFATCQLVRDELSNDEMAGIMLDRNFLISAHVLGQPRPERYLARQIQRARDAVAAEDKDFFREESEDGKPGKIVPNWRPNILKALKLMGVSLSYDEFADRMLIAGLPGAGPQLDDAALIRLWLALDDHKDFRFRPSRAFFDPVIFDLARLNSFHPVCDYLASLVWDGEKRIDNWLHTYGGAEDTPFNRAAGRKWMVAGARRVRRPGCKFDEVLVLESPQGKEKSTALAVLAKKEEMFSDSLPLNAKNQETVEQLQGKWIVEAAELNGMKHGDIEHLKAFTARRVDRARMAFDRTVTDRPRQCVFAGTTNSDKYLRDKTGNRRFWPVRIKAFDIAALQRDVDQLWAEAAAAEATGESIRLEESLWGAAAVEQEKRTLDDPYQIQLESILGDLNGKIRSVDVFKITGVTWSGKPDQTLMQRVGEAMKALGWDHCRLRFGGGLEGAYVRGEKWERGNQIVLRVEEGAGGRLSELRAVLAPGSVKEPQAQAVLALGDDSVAVEDKPPF